MTMSLMKQNPDAWAFLAWWSPPDQLMAMSADPFMSFLVPSREAPVYKLQKRNKPLNTGQSSPILNVLAFSFSALSLLTSCGVILWYDHSMTG